MNQEFEVPIRLLVLDDNEKDFRQLSDLLAATDLPHELEWVHDCSEGLARMTENRHDLCLLDDRLKARSGLDVLAAARELGCRMPVILLNSEDDDETVEAAFAAGADETLSKRRLLPRVLERTLRHAVCQARTAKELERSNALLCRSQAELGHLKEALDQHAIVSIADVAGNITYVNDMFCEVSGYSRAELIGQNHRIIKSGVHDQAFYEEMWSTITRGQTWHGEVCNRRKQGELYWVRGTIVPFLDANGVPYQYVSVRTDITAIKQTKEALEESEERLRRSQVYANIGTWDWNIQTGELYWSERIGPLFGYEGLVDTTYENFLKAVHPDDRQRVIDAVTACVERGEKYEIEHRIVRPDGTDRWLLERGDVSRAPDGTPQHMLGVVQDIDDRKRAEMALAESERQLREAQALARIGNWQADLKNGKLTWSEEIYRIFGREPGRFEPSVHDFQAAVHPDDLERVLELQRQSEQTGRLDVIHRIVRPDGKVRHVHELAQAETDAAGNLVRLAGTVQDITERVEAEARLRETEARFAFAVEGAGDGVWDWDMRTNAMQFSRCYMSMLGYAENELPNTADTWINSVHPEDMPRVLKNLHDYLEGRIPNYAVELRLRCKDGSYKWILCRGTVVARDREGKPARMTGIHTDITERKQAEESLRESEARLANAHRIAHLGNWDLDLATGEVVWSEEVYNIYGQDPETFSPDLAGYYALVHPEDRALVKATEERTLQEGRGEVVHRVLRPDGEPRYVSLVGELIRDPHGVPGHLTGTVQDITVLKLAEEAAKQSEELLRKFYELSPLGIAQNSMDGRFLQVNQALVQMTGYREKELLALSYWELTPIDYEQDEQRQLQSLNERGSYGPYEKEYIHKDGHRFPVLLNGVKVTDRQGREVIWSIVQDISERKRNERELLRLAERNRALMESAYDAILIADTQGRHLDVNRHAEEITGYSREQLLSMHASQMVPESAASQVADTFRRILEAGSALDHFEILRADGTLLPVDISGTLLSREGERYILGVFRDVSERIEREAAMLAAKEEAEKANRAKSDFLSSMSHELRTPMNAILGFAQLLLMNRSLEAVARENVQEILNAGQHLLELINEVLDLAKIEAGRIDLCLEPVAASPLIQECLSLIHPLAEERGIRIQDLTGTARPVWFRGDRTRLRQIIINLLSNAIKYNRPEGQVTLRLQAPIGGRVRLEVEDTGTGISPEQQASVFEPFQRLGVEQQHIEGTGIGLVICKRLIEAMGGEIGFESRPGVGSTFWLQVPVEEPAASGGGNEPAGEQTKPEPASGAESTILYVEDNPINLRLVEKLLSRRPGIRLISAHTPELGLELVRAHRPDLVLLDINLPGMDGYEVLSRLRRDPQTAALPVVAISANAMPADIERGRAAGFNEYLTKPIDIRLFYATLDAILQEART